MRKKIIWAASSVLFFAAVVGAVDDTVGPVAGLVEALSDQDLQRLVNEVLARNPKVAVASAEARAAAFQAPRLRSLPDPTVGLTWFLLSPQTRVGPQRATLSLAQRIPWFGNLELEEQVAVLDAAGAEARVEGLRLALVTEVRELYGELLYEDFEEKLIRHERETLERYEELARARYETGVGLAQAVVKLQAEIAMTEARRLQKDENRVHLIVAINALRDLPGDTPVRRGPGETPYAVPLDRDSLRSRALAARPEVAIADVDIEAAEMRIQVADRKSRPALTVGLTYGWVDRRDDAAGRLNPPEGNGDDILGLSVGTTVPLWGEANAAWTEEAVERRMASSEKKRAILADIEGGLGDHLRRIPLLREQLVLFETTLLLQVEESLRLAEVAYASGTAGALDLLDAERMLFGVRRGIERARTDLTIAIARLEGVIAGPLATPVPTTLKKQGLVLQKTINTETQRTQRRKHRGETSVSPGTRTSSAMVRRETYSKKQFLSYASLLPQHASRVTGLRGIPFEEDHARVGLVRPSGRSPHAESLHFDGTPCVQVDGWLSSEPAKRVGERRERPRVALCVPLCLCGESALRPGRWAVSEAGFCGSGSGGNGG